MPLYCPSCQATSAAADRCHRCGDRLVAPSEAVPTGPALPPPEPIKPTAGGRAALGCIAALGLYLGLREWVAAADPTDEWWAGAVGVAVAIGLRAAGVIVGGLFAGAGRPAGASTGVIVGLVCGGLYLVMDIVSGAGMLAVDGVAWAGLAILAAAAGQVGGLVWPPPVELPDPEPVLRSSLLARLTGEGKKDVARPTAWVRIAVGAGIAVAGFAVADVARDGLKRGSAGMLNLGGPPQAPLVDLQLAALAVGLAGIIAGSSTGSGLRHGVYCGLLAATAVVTLSVTGIAVGPVVEGLLRVLDLPPDDPESAVAILATFAAVLGACAVGGWFGGQLLPPLAPLWMRKKLIPMS